MASPYRESLKLVRSISHLLRHEIKGKVTESPIFDIIKQTIRQHEVTERKFCRAPQELEFLGQTYLTYLESGKKYRALFEKFYAKPERSVEETAKMVGFKLPERRQ